MTNIDKAAEVIRTARAAAPYYRGMEDTSSPFIAEVLADNGLLMPELPEPDGEQPWTGRKIWRTVDGAITADGKVRLRADTDDPRKITPDAARKMAYALLAAADHAEKQAEE